MSVELPASWGDKQTWSIPHHLDRQASIAPDRPFLQIEAGAAVTFGEMRGRARRAAAALASVGVRQGSTVVIMAPTSLEFVDVWFGTNLLGAADVPLNVAYRSHTLSHGVNTSEAQVMVIHGDYLPLLAEVEEDLRHLTTVVVLGASDVRLERLTVVAFDDLPSAPVPALPPVGPRDLATVLYTSGTSGPAKGVLMPHAQVYAIAREVIDGLRIGPDDIFYCFHPLFHMAGKYGGIYAALILGSKIVLDRSFDAAVWIDRVRQYGATVSIAHGPMIEMIHAQPERIDDAENPLRSFIAAPFPAAIANDFERRFDARGIEVWGMTEVTCVSWQPFDEPVRLGSCGKPREDLFEVLVVDPDTDEPVPVGSAGEITVRPLHAWTTMQGYIGMPEQTIEAWRNLRFHTGDLGRFDEDGYLYFVDRTKDRIRRKAENISSYDVEVAALSHPGVLECAAIGIAAEFTADDEIKIVVVPREGVELDPVSLVTHMTARLPHYMVPRFVEMVEALPRTPTNKVQKNVLRQLGVTETTWDRREAGVSVRALRDQMEVGR